MDYHKCKNFIENIIKLKKVEEAFSTVAKFAMVEDKLEWITFLHEPCKVCTAGARNEMME